MKISLRVARVCALLLCVCGSLTAFADITTGVNWLATQQTASGSFGTPTSLATDVQSTAEVLRTYRAMGQSSAAALAFLNNGTEDNTEFLSRRIVANVEAGNNVSALVNTLLARQNIDGGFGDQAGHSSSVLDSAFALQALAQANVPTGTQIARVVGFLTNRQQVNGGWFDGSNQTSVYLTALVVQAIAPYRNVYLGVASTVTEGQNYLLSQRGLDGAWSERFLSALSLNVLIPMLSDFNQVSASVDALLSAQLANGSWENDAYTTALAVRALWLAGNRPPAGSLSHLQGNVIDAVTHLPLAGVQVSLNGPVSLSMLSGNTGEFAFRDIPSGSYTLTLSLNGYSTLTTVTTTQSGIIRELGSLAITSQISITTGTIIGIVIDGSTGQPLSGVGITAGSRNATTGADGGFQIANVTPGAVTIQASRAGYSSASGSANVTAGGTLVFSPSLFPAATPTTAILGTVTNGSTGAPLAGATVSITGSTQTVATTDAQGRYRVEPLNSGLITIIVSASGYDSVTATATVVTNTIFDFSPRLYPENSTPPDANSSAVRGVIYDASTNQPLAGVTATIMFGGVTRNVTSGTDGRFEVAGLSAGDGSVSFALSGYVSYNLTLNLAPLTMLDLGQIRLRRDIAAVLLPDLVVTTVDSSQAMNDPQSFTVSGAITATIANQGTAGTFAAAAVIAFEDTNRNGQYDDGDMVLGTTSISLVDAQQSQVGVIPLSGVLSFRDAPIQIWVDGAQAIAESNEDNNILSNSGVCEMPVRTISGITVPAGYNVELFASAVTNQQGLIQFAFDSLGNLYLAPGSGSTMIKFPVGSNVGVPFGSGLNDPDGVVVDSQNNVIVAGPVRKYSPSGTLLWTASCPGNLQLAAIDASDNVYIGSLDGTICKVSANGSVQIFSGLGQASSPVIGPDGFLYIARVNPLDIIKVDPVTGAVLQTIANIGANNPVFGPDGHLYIDNGPVSRITFPDGVSSVFASGFPDAGALAFDASGQLYVGENTTRSIYRIYPRTVTSDLTAGNLKVTPGPAGVTLTARVGNASSTASSGSTVRYYEGNPVSGGRVLGQVSLASLAPGESVEVSLTGVTSLVGSIALYAVVDPDNRLNECRETNNSISIPGPALFADLVVTAVDVSTVSADAQTLALTGSVNLVVANPGTLGAPAGVRVLAFHDANGNQVYDEGVELSFGTAQLVALPVGSQTSVVVPLDGQLPFRDAPISVWVDSARVVAELSETNNVGTSAVSCSVVEPAFVETTISFEDFTAQQCPPHTAFSPTRYASQGVIFNNQNNGNPLCWNAGSSPSVLQTPDGGAHSVPFGVIGNLDGTIGVRARFVDPTTQQPRTVNMVRVVALSGPGSDLLSPNVALVGFNAAGNEIVRDIANTTLQFDTLEIRANGIASVLMTAGNNRDAYDNFTYGIATAGNFRTLDPVLKWHWSGSANQPTFNQVMMAPSVAQTNDDNGDGQINSSDNPDVIFAAYGGAGTSFGASILRIISGRDGSEIATVTDPTLRLSSYGNIAVGDIDGDGLIEIVGPLSSGGLVAFEHDGTLKWRRSIPTMSWNFGGPSIADLDADGTPEIVFGHRAFNADGTLRWTGTGGFTIGGTHPNGSLSIVADLNLTGRPAVIVGGSAYNSDGSLRWRNNTVGDGLVAVGNFDADPNPEIVVVANLGTLSGRVFLLNHDGSIIWGPTFIPGGGRGGAPTVADFDGDGQPEIGVAGSTRYAVFETDGTVKWTSVIQDATSNITGSSVFDFDGDGQAEVVYADELNLRIYRGATGEVLSTIRNSSGTAYELPVIVDLDNDGHSEIVVASNLYLGNTPGSTTGVRVFQDRNNSWVSTRSLWNQHSYHISNINDDGTIPRVETPSWQTHNTYRLNSFPNVSGSVLSDLTASLLRLMDQGTGQGVRLSLRVGNAGMTSVNSASIAFYDGDPAAGGILLGTTGITSVAGNSFQDVVFDSSVVPSGTRDIYAVVDSNNSVAECREDNNSTHTSALANVRGSVSVSSDRAVYGASGAVLLRGLVTNTGALANSYSVSLRLEDTQGELVQDFPMHSISTLNGGGTTTITDSWNTGTTIAGTYVLRGQLRDMAGGLLSESSATFEIRHSDTDVPHVTLRVTTDRTTYNVTDMVELESLVRNVTTNTVIDGAQLRIVVRDGAGTIVFSRDNLLAQLIPGALRNVTLPYTFTGAAMGNYSVQGQVLDAGGAVLASSSTQYSVVADVSKLLTGSVAVGSTSIDIGATQLCTYTVVNRGAMALNGAELRLSVGNLSTGTAVSSELLVLNLGAGDAQTILRSVATHGFTPGDYTCALEVRGDTGYRSLGHTEFRANERPIRVDASMRIGSKGRLLILLDPMPLCASNATSCPSGADPHGPSGAPSLASQRAFLENLLTEAGWLYTITERADAFMREARTGHYELYAIFAEQEKLAEQNQKELREAVFRGEGLVIAGMHDHRDLHKDKLLDALGIDIHGHDPRASDVELVPNVLGPTGHTRLLQGDQALRILKNDAQTAIRYLQFSNGNHGPDAATFNHYGRGKDVFFGFDLLALAARDGADSLAARTLLASLALAHPETLTARLGANLPIDLVLKNQGVAAAVSVTVTMPAGVQVAHAGGGTVQNTAAGQTLTWTVDLALGAERRLGFVVRLPDMQANLTLRATVNATGRLIAETGLTLVVEPLVRLEDLAANARALQQSHAAHAQALRGAADAINRATAARSLEEQVDHLLKATDDLLRIEDPEIVALRRGLDLWLRYVSKLIE